MRSINWMNANGEEYRSGHNGAVLKTVWGVSPTWVRILPPPPKGYNSNTLFAGECFGIIVKKKKP